MNRSSHLCHDFVLALLDVLPVRLHDSLEEAEELDVAAVGLNGVDEVVHHAVANVVTQLEVVHEDVPHGLRLQQLPRRETHRGRSEKITPIMERRRKASRIT